MASIRKRGKTYLVVVSMGYDYKKERIKPVQKTFRPPDGLTPKQEEKWIKEQAVVFEMSVRDVRQPINRNMRLAEFIGIWQKEIAPERLSAKTIARAKQDILRILPAIGNLKLTDTTTEVLRRFYDELRNEKNKKTGEPISETTAEGVHANLSAILSCARERGYIQYNPAFGAFKRKTQRRHRSIPEEEQLKQLLAALEDERPFYEAYFKLLITTGMRRGECCALKWSDIDFKKRTIRIERSAIKQTGKKTEVKQPKTAAGTRTVYISGEMCGVLKKHRAALDEELAEMKAPPVADDDYVFRQLCGQPTPPDSFTRRFAVTLKRCGLDSELWLHGLRHAYASLLISRGVDVVTVASLLGHAQASTTLDIYSHAFDKNKRDAQEKIERALEI